MIGRVMSGHGFWIALGVLSVAIVFTVGFMVANIAVPELRRAGIIEPTSTAKPSASAPASVTASPSLIPIDMGGAAIPADADCGGCHTTSSGAIGLGTIPVMAHPQEGWSKCTSCHATARLVDTAPGHAGIHASECTVCHEPGDLQAPLSRPHRDNQNVACLSCHGSTAPLPSDMTHRKETVCWLCHRLPSVEPPVPAHATAPGEADCLTCHSSGGKAGKLPSDHLERPASLCLSCHEVTLGATSSTPPRVTIWPVGSSPSPTSPASPASPASPDIAPSGAPGGSAP